MEGLEQIVSEVLEIPLDEVSEDTSPKSLSQKSNRGQNLKYSESDAPRAGNFDSRGTRLRFHCFVPRTLWTDSKTTRNWDSLRHINLVLALEQKYGVKFAPAEIMLIGSLAEARALLQQKGVAA